jgi:(heptosyl)LPS beta-1,4-glucosyltransferase
VPPLSVVICTKDEERHIGRCLDSVRWADERLVLDTGSRDATREVALRHGAVVHEDAWRGFSRTKNRAAAFARNEWILSLDADEVVTQELAASVQAVLAGSPDARDGYAVDRRGDFLGRWLPNQARGAKRRGLVRLYHRGASGWDERQEVHEVVRCPGMLHALRGPLLHWNEFTLDELLTLFNRYATIEARELAGAGRRTNALEVVLRPLARFAWLYLGRGELRLGGHGLVHAGLKAVSEYMRYAKLWELQRSAWPPPLPDGAGHAEERGLTGQQRE